MATPGRPSATAIQSSDIPHTYNRASVTLFSWEPYVCTCGLPLLNAVHPHHALVASLSGDFTGPCVCTMPINHPCHLRGSQ